MLKQRILTALVMLLVLAAASTVGQPYGFPLLALLLVGVLAGEWLMLLRWTKPTAIVVAGAMTFALWILDTTSVATTILLVFCATATAVWLALALCLFTSGRFPPTDRWRAGYAALALLLPGATWLALVAAYRHGLVFMVSILAIVWAADIAAYFAGRAFGKRKLAPAISPGKTWAGAIGGAVAALLLAVAALLVPSVDSVFAIFDRRWSWAPVLVATLVLAMLSVVGDLFESHLKRQRGVKDSGTLLPGHGGVFDRLDALLPIVPATMLLMLST